MQLKGFCNDRIVTLLNMMKIISATLFLTVSAVSMAFDHTVDFESFPGMLNAGGANIPVASRLSDQLQSTIGINFASSSPFVAVVNLGMNHATSGTRGIAGSTTAGIITYSSSNPINFTFWDPTNIAIAAGTDSFSVRGDLIAAGGTMSLTGFDINNNVIDSLSVTDTGGTTMVLNSATKNIHRVRFIGTGNVALDDVQFNTVEAVPEPATMTVFALASLAVARRRQRKISN